MQIGQKAEEAPETKAKAIKSWRNGEFFAFIRTLIISVIIVAPIRIFIAQPFIVSGRSMDPTFRDGEYLIVDQLSYRFEDPKRGDVIIFKYPEDRTKYFIKRVVALPGERVAIRSGMVIVKKSGEQKSYSLNEPFIENRKEDDMLEKRLKLDEYFVMGDNRAQSLDSRYWGPLQRELVTGRVIARLLPLKNIGIWPGEVDYNQSSLVK